MSALLSLRLPALAALVLAAVLHVQIAAAQPVVSPKHEMRAGWIATVSNLDWLTSRTLTTAQQQRQLRDLLDGAKAAGLNAVLSQVRPEADALYASPYEPCRDRAGGWCVSIPNILEAPMRRADIYHSDPGILGGTPVFTGTRVPVDSLIAHLKAGDPIAEFLAGFPTVQQEQAEAFLDLALEDALGVTPHEHAA